MPFFDPPMWAEKGREVMKLHARALGLTMGVIWGVMVFLVTLLAVWSSGGYGKSFLVGVTSIYPGFTISYKGALLGLFYGFLDGFVFGWFTAVIYNYFAK